MHELGLEVGWSMSKHGGSRSKLHLLWPGDGILLTVRSKAVLSVDANLGTNGHRQSFLLAPSNISRNVEVANKLVLKVEIQLSLVVEQVKSTRMLSLMKGFLASCPSDCCSFPEGHIAVYIPPSLSFPLIYINRKISPVEIQALILQTEDQNTSPLPFQEKNLGSRTLNWHHTWSRYF